MSTSFYGKSASRQMQGKFTRPAAGLNQYTPSIEINDNLLSNCLDATPYKETGILLYSEATSTTPITAASTESLGQAHISIADENGNLGECIVSLTEDGVNGSIVHTDIATTVQTLYDITALGIPASLTGSDRFSVCKYATEATNYVVFSCDAIQKLIWFNYTTFGSVDLPFYPTKIVSYANRIFALDDKNTLWWSKAGNPFNIAPATDAWYSAITESQILEDAGYWVVERERLLEEICVINEAIYIFGRSNIYIFQGTNYDTFQLSLLISDFGIRGDMYVDHLTVTNNIAYIVDDGKVYEFNGSQNPRLISHPIFVNTGLTNGVLGGIPQIEFSYISSDRNFVYYYQRWHCLKTADTVSYEYLYMFDIKTRTWWKLSTFNDNTTGLSNQFHTQIIPSNDMSTSYSIVSDWTVTRYWYIYTQIGTKYTDNPYIITKAFNDMPSETGTLTGIVLQLQGTENDTADIIVSYSTHVEDDTTFEDFYNENEHIFTGDIENIFIPVPVSAIANKHHYRLKIEIVGDSVVVYNVERRFRVKGLSR